MKAKCCIGTVKKIKPDISLSFLSIGPFAHLRWYIPGLLHAENTQNSLAYDAYCNTFSETGTGSPNPHLDVPGG